MMKEFLEQFNEVMSWENVKYFYHVTNCNPELILSEGLFLVENNIFSTAIEIPEEFKKDPINYCDNEKGRFYRKNPFIVLIAIDTDKIDYLVQPSIYPPQDWIIEDEPNFYIPSKYILGYIDTTQYKLVLNEEFELTDEIYLKWFRKCN